MCNKLSFGVLRLNWANWSESTTYDINLSCAYDGIKGKFIVS